MKIVLLRRSEEGMSGYKRDMLIKAFTMLFPNRIMLGFQRTDPQDHIQHDISCGEGPVLLPDKPIPIKAIGRGVPHLFFAEDGLHLLKKIKVESELLVPFKRDEE